MWLSLCYVLPYANICLLAVIKLKIIECFYVQDRIKQHTSKNFLPFVISPNQELNIRS